MANDIDLKELALAEQLFNKVFEQGSVAFKVLEAATAYLKDKPQGWQSMDSAPTSEIILCWSEEYGAEFLMGLPEPTGKSRQPHEMDKQKYRLTWREAKNRSNSYARNPTMWQRIEAPNAASEISGGEG